MENNKILIGIQFVRKIASSADPQHINFELYVLRDITLGELLDGILIGMRRLSQNSIFNLCATVLNACRTSDDKNWIAKTITFTSLNPVKMPSPRPDRPLFHIDVTDIGKTQCDLNKRLSDLGFISSTCLYFDPDLLVTPKTEEVLTIKHVIEAFHPKKNTVNRLIFPHYNISSRQLYRFDDTPVEIIPPSDPPKKPEGNLLTTLLPSFLSIAGILLMRTMMGGTSVPMILASVALSAVSIVTPILGWKKQQKTYKESLDQWKSQYEDYINELAEKIIERQKRDAEVLDRLYPAEPFLISTGTGVYSLQDQIYCRSPQDADFLTIRLGFSAMVPSMFEIKGERRDVIFSSAFYTERDGFKLSLTPDPNTPSKRLCDLPADLAAAHACMAKAPMLYSLKDKGAIGIVERKVNKVAENTDYFISKLIYELCYYHAPETLQFVVFYNTTSNWMEIEKIIAPYKFMPHFHGLFSNMSQFAFDKVNANLLMSQLMSLMADRQQNAQDGSPPMPHIVLIVHDEHGLKEHAFAEFLPKAPPDGTPFVNTLGLTFVFTTQFKEHLPAYCDDIIRFDTAEKSLTVTPRSNLADQKLVAFAPTREFSEGSRPAFGFLSALYYTQIAQNGQVPSSVNLCEINLKGGTLGELQRVVADLQEGRSVPKDVVDVVHKVIASNWGLDGSARSFDITSSISVPLGRSEGGRTESGITCLNLHEKADGPHMLVAGTTGSGKSETVISYLLGLCMQFTPEEVNLLLVDMKGGGFTKRIGTLPHVVGSVTDVDGDENGTSGEYMLSRFLSAMKFEIKRRKLLLNKMHVDHVDSYIRACRNIMEHVKKKNLYREAAELKRLAAEEPLSHLFLVVDEFTELKRFSGENSNMDFMGEITTIARIGRSLGIHIILISQNIEGAITDDIRANTNARLCLKVATRQASKDMINTELAASPMMPGNGRAYLLVGTGSKFEYFQSAYSGLKIGQKPSIEITIASRNGANTPLYRSGHDAPEPPGSLKTELDTIVEAIKDCSAKAIAAGKLRKPHVVFRPPLPAGITWDPQKKAIQVVDMKKR